LRQNNFNGELTKEQLERFRFLIQAAPKSEQTFYLSDLTPGALAVSGKSQLGDALKRTHSWYQLKYQEELKELHLTFGTIEALQIAFNGVHGACANRTKIGKIDINTVKESVEYNQRPTAVSIPESGVMPTTENIHDYPYSPMPVVTAHDVFH